MIEMGSGFPHERHKNVSPRQGTASAVPSEPISSGLQLLRANPWFSSGCGFRHAVDSMRLQPLRANDS